MMMSQQQQRLPWSDRFTQPTPEQLRGGLDETASELFDRFRQGMTAVDGAREQIEWFGEPWKWTLQYDGSNLDEPLIVLIARPGDLQAAMPIERDFAATLIKQKIKRTVAEGLELVLEPYETRWATWSLIAPGVVDDILTVVQKKLEYLGQTAG